MSRSRRFAKTAQASATEPRPRSGREIAAAWFSFHRVCPRRDCRRANRCTGGAMPPCFTAFWRLIDEREKTKFRATFKARGEGASASEAIAAGEAEAVRHDELMARLAAHDQARESGNCDGALRQNTAPHRAAAQRTGERTNRL